MRQHRSQPIPSRLGPPFVPITTTAQPASILRGPPESREAELRRFVSDLRAARALIAPRGYFACASMIFCAIVSCFSSVGNRSVSSARSLGSVVVLRTAVTSLMSFL